MTWKSGDMGVGDRTYNFLESLNKEEKSFEVRQREAQTQRKRKKKKKSEKTIVASSFSDIYKLTGETLGEGSYGKVETCINIFTELEYAVKIIEARPGLYSRSKVLKEIEIYHMCRGQPNIIQLVEYFEEEERFCLVFEKIRGGPLLDHIQTRICFTEAEASSIVQDLAGAIRFLHQRGVAHRDLKPDNVLCVNSHSPCPIKLGDFDLCSRASIDISTPNMLTPVGSLEYMAPEVVQTFLIDDYDDDDDEEEISYNKKCDLWSLGIIMYILLCGYAPFSGNCGLDCGWERGESCLECQELLFMNIKEGKVIFPEQHWSSISAQAKNLIQQLLVKDSSLRLNSEEVLAHPWIVGGGCTNTLNTPSILRRQTSIKDLEDFASRAMAVNRAVEEGNHAVAMKVPARSETWSFDSSPPNISTFSNYEIMQKRRKSRVNLWDKQNKFCSIDELELENDFFMKAI